VPLLFFSVSCSEFFPQPYETCPASDFVVISHASEINNAFNSLTAENSHRLITYFTPYLGVFSLRFFLALVHELGHAIPYWFFTREWPTITVGDDEVQNGRIFDFGTLKLFLPDSDSMHFCGSTDPCSNSNPFIDACISLMGPLLHLVVAMSLMQLIQKPLFHFVVAAEITDNIFENIFNTADENSDGFLALQSLGWSTDWMRSFENNEGLIATSTFDLMYLQQLVDVLMFSKLFRTRSEQQRIIILGGRFFFTVMIPYVLNAVRFAVQKSIDYAHEQVNCAETLTVGITHNSTIQAWWNFSRFWLTVVIPVLFMHQLIILNAHHSIAHHMTCCFTSA
jgi:hypothetical protein